MKNKLIDLVLIAAFVVCAVVIFRMQYRPVVGVVDMPRLVRETGLRESIETRMSAAERELLETARRREGEYTANRRTLTAEENRDEEALARLDRAFQQDVRQLQETVAARRQAVNAVLRRYVQPAAAQIARRRRLHIVLDASANTLYVTRQADLTDELVPLLRAAQVAVLDDIEKVITGE